MHHWQNFGASVVDLKREMAEEQAVHTDLVAYLKSNSTELSEKV